MSSRCESCGVLLEPFEMFRTIELEDGTKKEIIDNMCNPCLSLYVTHSDELDSHSYAFEHEIDILKQDFTSYSE